MPSNPGIFAKQSVALYKQFKQLQKYREGGVQFDSTNGDHSTLMCECTGQVQEKLKALQDIDTQIGKGFAAGIGAYVLSFLLPFTPLSIMGFSYAAYHYGLRKQAYLDYTCALDNLVDCCEWSFRNTTTSTIEHKSKVMIATLAPVMYDHQLSKYMSTEVFGECKQTIDDARKGTTAMPVPSNQLAKDMFYYIYGYKQGGFTAILTGLGFSLYEGVKNMFALSNFVPNQPLAPN